MFNIFFIRNSIPLLQSNTISTNNRHKSVLLQSSTPIDTQIHQLFWSLLLPSPSEFYSQHCVHNHQLRPEMERQQVNDIEEQISINIDYNEIPDAGSEECDSGLGRFGVFTDNGMVKIDEGNCEHDLVRKCFLSGMGSLANETRIVAIHKNLSSTLTGKVRLNSYKIFYNAMLKKYGGDANVRYSWYGAARNEIREILCHGFSTHVRKVAGNGEMYGIGVHLSHSKFPIDSVLSSEVDENGLRHVLLCRVILGKMEEVAAGSRQFHPSSMEFDSGVNNLAAPSRYIVWSCSVNSYIFPSHIVSFRFPFYEGSSTVPPSRLQLRASTIIKILAMFLDQHKMAIISSWHHDFQAKMIRWEEFMQRVEQLSGRKLIGSILKLHKSLAT